MCLFKPFIYCFHTSSSMSSMLIDWLIHISESINMKAYWELHEQNCVYARMNDWMTIKIIKHYFVGY